MIVLRLEGFSCGAGFLAVLHQWCGGFILNFGVIAAADEQT
jgi:hypothetical protein